MVRRVSRRVRKRKSKRVSKRKSKRVSKRKNKRVSKKRRRSLRKKKSGSRKQRGGSGRDYYPDTESDRKAAKERKERAERAAERFAAAMNSDDYADMRKGFEYLKKWWPYESPYPRAPSVTDQQEEVFRKAKERLRVEDEVRI